MSTKMGKAGSRGDKIWIVSDQVDQTVKQLDQGGTELGSCVTKTSKKGTAASRGDIIGIVSDQVNQSLNSWIQGGQNWDCERPSQPNCERLGPGGQNWEQNWFSFFAPFLKMFLD